MKIALLQTDIAWEDAAHNRAHVESLLDGAPIADLYVLPEMFTTGFCTEPQGVAEPAHGLTLTWMREQSAKRGAALAGSVAVQEEGKMFNRFYFVCPNGDLNQADKHHLFTFGGEDKQYTAGAERVVVRYGGVRILLQVCYDLRFPVWARNRGDYDMILYVANWPTVRIQAWHTLLRARAIENQCYVAGVNRVGTDPFNAYCGGTELIDFMGNTIIEAAQNHEDVVVADLDMEGLQAFQKSFPALQDADDFQIKN